MAHTLYRINWGYCCHFLSPMCLFGGAIAGGCLRRTFVRNSHSAPGTPFAIASSILKCQQRNLYNSDANKSHQLCHFCCFPFDYRLLAPLALPFSQRRNSTTGRTNELKGKNSFRFETMVCELRHTVVACMHSIWALSLGEVRIMGRLCQVNMYLAAPFCLR